MKTKELEYLDTFIDLREREMAARQDVGDIKIAPMFEKQDMHIVFGIEQIALQTGSKLELLNNRSEYYYYRVRMTYRGLSLFSICDDHELNKLILMNLIDEDRVIAVRQEVAEYQMERAKIAVSKMAIAN